MKPIIPILAALYVLCRPPSLAAQGGRDIPLTDTSPLRGANGSPATVTPQTGLSHANSDEESDADRLIRHAAESIPSYKSIEAKIRTRFDVYDRQMNGTGSYQQQGRDGDLQLRLELKVALDDQRINSFLQVGDGKTLWTHQDQGDRQPLRTQIDLQKIRTAAERKEPWLPTGGANSLGLGGVPQLVKGLASSFHFWEAVPGELQGSKIWTLRGGWKSHRLVQLLPEQKAMIEKGEPPNLRNLPSSVPWGVELDLGQDDFFPYRVTYFRPPTGQEKKFGPRPLTEVLPSSKAIVAIEFFELKFNAPIQGQPFIYPIGDQKPTDQTDAVLTAMGLQDQKPK